MHSDWFNGIEILQGRWQHGEKVRYCYPSGLEKTLCRWDIHRCPAGHERVNFLLLLKITVKKSKMHRTFEESSLF
jgi:hypothetical protein